MNVHRVFLISSIEYHTELHIPGAQRAGSLQPLLCSPQRLRQVPLLWLSKWHCELVSINSTAELKPARTLTQSVRAQSVFTEWEK